MYRQGTLFISDWVDQTSLYFDSPVPLAALLMNIFHNIFLSYGLANCMITAANIYLFHCILKDLDFPEMSRLIVLAFFLCPYLTTPFDIVNDLGYYSCLFVSAGFYSVKILISLMYLAAACRQEKCMDALNGNRSFCERDVQRVPSCHVCRHSGMCVCSMVFLDEQRTEGLFQHYSI